MIPLRKLRRAHKHLQAFCNELDAAYPDSVEATSNEGDDWSETIRNAQTTLCHLGPWIGYRERHRCDPREQPKE